MHDNRRAHPRHLCTEEFKILSFTISGQEISVTPINYNRNGIAIFTNDYLLEGEEAVLSFEIQNQAEVLKLDSIRSTVKYFHQSEVGNTLGLEFESSDLSLEQLEMLICIEKNLCDNQLDDRYF